jgi:hypothetical protein
MDHGAIVVLILVGAVVIGAIVAYAYAIWRRARSLRRQFGREYDRVLGREKSIHRAQGVLQFRQIARKTLNIRPLSRQDQAKFVDRWSKVQREFADNPREAVLHADNLVNEVLQRKGYPASSFEERANFVFADYPVVIENYRVAHGIADTQRNGQATTDDLHTAMVHYRSLFDELLSNSFNDFRREARG